MLQIYDVFDLVEIHVTNWYILICTLFRIIATTIVFKFSLMTTNRWLKQSMH